jgi:excisionase family DNA binding protein
MPDTLLDIRELQRRLSCGRSAAYALVGSGVLPTVRVGRAVRVPESALAAFINNGGARVIPRPTETNGQESPASRLIPKGRRQR